MPEIKVIKTYENGMKLLSDGSWVDIPVVRHPALPPNTRQEDSLLNATTMSKGSKDLLAKIIHNCTED